VHSGQQQATSAASGDAAPRPPREAFRNGKIVDEELIMNAGTRRRPLRSSGRLRRLAARRPAGTLLLAAAIVVAALTLVVAGMPALAAGIVRTAGIMLLLLSPTLLVASAMYGADAVRAIRDRLADRRGGGIPQPDGPPIEKLAADLRRLLWHHDRVAQSIDAARSTLRLRALQAAITMCATQAARALDVPYPDPPTDAGIDTPHLRRLLQALAAAGLVLPPAVQLLAPDGRR
jgi:hypothetical protein